MKLIDADEQVSEGYLQDWYINSVGDEDPVWTDAHIEELIKDFVVIPRSITNNSYSSHKIIEQLKEACVTNYDHDGNAVVCVPVYKAVHIVEGGGLE